MPLTHVNMWDDKNGWRRISPGKAFLKYRRTVSADSGLFICELCGQKVAFAVGDIKDPYFMHPSGSKDCDEKTTSLISHRNYNPLGFSLPIKIHLLNEHISVFIGFPPLSVRQLTIAKERNDKVIIQSFNNRIDIEYTLTEERFSTEHIVWLNAGVISDEYKILCSTVDKYTWPRLVDGVDSQGTLFDIGSGRRLPRNADVVVKREYVLITSKTYLYAPSGISVSKRVTVGRWSIYIISASQMSKTASDFFLAFNVRLTEEAVEITPVWPISIHSSHSLSYAADHLWFFKSHEGVLETYPVYPRPQCQGRLYKIIGTTQTVSVSRFEERTSVLRYTVMRKMEETISPRTKYTVQFCDLSGVPIDIGKQTALPKQNTITIKATYDGAVEIYKKSVLMNRLGLEGNKPIQCVVSFGLTIIVYQGGDKAAELSYERTTPAFKRRDDELLELLRTDKSSIIPMNHTVGVIAGKLKDLPKSKAYVLRCLREGRLGSNSLLLLRKVVEDSYV